MTATEQQSVQKLSENQAVMRERQHTMQGDIDELKKIAKEVNNKLDNVTKEVNNKLDVVTKVLDELTGGKKMLWRITGVILTITGLIAAYINVFKEK